MFSNMFFKIVFSLKCAASLTGKGFFEYMHVSPYKIPKQQHT